jgi:hypothetical protein
MLTTDDARQPKYCIITISSNFSSNDAGSFHSNNFNTPGNHMEGVIASLRAVIGWLFYNPFNKLYTSILSKGKSAPNQLNTVLIPANFVFNV